MTSHESVSIVLPGFEDYEVATVDVNNALAEAGGVNQYLSAIFTRRRHSDDFNYLLIRGYNHVTDFGYGEGLSSDETLRVNRAGVRGLVMGHEITKRIIPVPIDSKPFQFVSYGSALSLQEKEYYDRNRYKWKRDEVKELSTRMASHGLSLVNSATVSLIEEWGVQMSEDTLPEASFVQSAGFAIYAGYEYEKSRQARGLL